MLRQTKIQVTATVQRELAMQAAADLGREHARTGTRPFETELETAARLADVLHKKGCALPGDNPSPQELLWEYRFAFGYEKAEMPGPGRPVRKGMQLHQPNWPDGTSRPLPAGRSVPQQKADGYHHLAQAARSESSTREAAPMTAQDDEKHYEQEETRAKTGTSKWTAEAIRALGATTDLQTLADIFGCSGWSSRKMARTG